MIKATIRRPIAALDYSRHGSDEGTSVIIEAGELELERIPNPIYPAMGDWFVSGTIGMSEVGWRHLTAGIDASVEDHPGEPEVSLEEDGEPLGPLPYGVLKFTPRKKLT